MESSILIGTKKILGLAEDYTAFDHDITTYLNSAFATLSQLGVGPTGGFMVEDELEEWVDVDLPDDQLNLVRTYVTLKVRMLFDPPTTSYLITAMNEQIREYEWRLNVLREVALDPTDPMTVVDEEEMEEV